MIVLYLKPRYRIMKFTEFAEKTQIIIRGAGDLATGVAVKLFNCGFPIIMLESEKPTVIRRTVSFAEAMFSGRTVVEGIEAVKTDIDKVQQNCTDKIQVVADTDGILIPKLKPQIVIDAIIAKKNLGTRIDMAPFVVALGPGFCAGTDCHAVIETQRGHKLGTIIYKGSAAPNTGIPGLVAGYGIERVMHSPCAGTFKAVNEIGDIVKAGDTVAYVDKQPVVAKISGKVRGLLHDGLVVPEHFKVADIDPRGEEIDHSLCSDKARTIAGGVLEAILCFLNK